jgi:hypothetical protein
MPLPLVDARSAARLRKCPRGASLPACNRLYCGAGCCAVLCRPHVQSFLGFGASPKIDLELSDVADRKMKKVEMVDGPPQHLHVFEGREPVRGRVRVTVPPGKKLEHLGIKVELKGTIGMGCAVWPRRGGVPATVAR